MHRVESAGGRFTAESLLPNLESMLELAPGKKVDYDLLRTSNIVLEVCIRLFPIACHYTYEQHCRVYHSYLKSIAYYMNGKDVDLGTGDKFGNTFGKRLRELSPLPLHPFVASRLSAG